MKMISDEKVIDGSSLYNMLRIAFTSLSYNESYLNDINTFPVSDSDTGTNMKRTLRMGLLTTSQEQTAGELIRSLADNMSLSSRGNSGFILSQYFMGLSEYLRDKNVITIEDFSKAIVHAYKVAYASVVNPAEGTMLTVMREGAKQTLDKFNNLSNGTFADFFNIFSESIFASTLKTSSQMSLLETNNVVDSGALGFYLIVEGMKKAFNENIPYFNCLESELLPKRFVDADTPLTFFRFCTEFTIRLKEKNTKEYFSNLLYGHGDSVVIAINKDLLKVHIHTNEPELIINKFKKFGSIVSTKVDDLFLTPQFSRLARRKHNDYAVVAFTYGDQSALLFERLGVDAAFAIPTNFIPSEESLKKLIEPFLNGKLIIYCADKKIEDLLKSIKWWGHFENMIVVECRGMVNAFFKLASSMFDSSFEDFQKHLYLLNKIKTIEFKITTNDNLFSQLETNLSPNRLEGYSTIVVFGGKNLSQDDIDTISNFFANNENIEFSYFQGGQEDSLFIIGAM